MVSMRTTLLGMLALIASLALAPSASAQPCAPQWDVEFGENGTTGTIWDSAVYDGGAGPALYICGSLHDIGGAEAWGIAKWDGQRWSQVGGGISRDGDSGIGASLLVWDDGRGPALYITGRFDHAGDIPVDNIARWDGTTWEALGAGIDDNGATELCAYDDGRGSALYVGGKFVEAGGQPANRIARWDGATWERLRDGIGVGGRVVGAMAVFDDGGGPALYVGGDFYGAGGISATYIARWNGHEWSALEGVNLTWTRRNWSPILEEMAVFDDGSGPALFMTGNFGQPGVGDIFLKWDGHEITAPSGILFDTNDYAETMTVHDDGDGATLWLVGGQFSIGERGNHTTIAKWDGDTWTKPAMYPQRWIYTLDFLDDEFGSTLYMAGDLRSIVPDGGTIHNITRWSAPHMALSHSPLRAGEQALFSTTCSTPGQRVNFIYSTTGLGSLYVPQLGVTLDLDRPHLAGFGIADAQGKAELTRTLPPDSSGRTIWMQTAEQGRKSEVVMAVVE